MHGIGRLLCAGGIGLGCLLSAAAPASADDSAQAQAHEREREREQAVARLEQNRESCRTAEAKLAELEAAYTRGMTSHDLEGEPREVVVMGIAEAKRQVEAAREAQPELFKAARASGVPWSVLDRYQELPAPPAAQQPTLEDNPNDSTTDGENVDAVDDARAGDSDAQEGAVENVDVAPDSDGENPDAVTGAEGQDSDDLRATSGDPD